MNGIPMYWNWVLDWFSFMHIDKKLNATTMNWNLVLDWVISDGSFTKFSKEF